MNFLSRLLFYRWSVPALALLMTPAMSQGGEADIILNQWFAAQTNVHTWSADFVQTRKLKSLTQPLKATGQVFVAIPDRFRWQLGQPAQTIALRQPDQLYVIYPRLKRAEKYPLNDKQPGPWRDALALLEAGFPRNRAELESHFNILSITPTNFTVQLRLQPKSTMARRMMPELEIAFRTNDFSLTMTEMKFTDGSSMRSDFTNALLNPNIPESTFEANLPADFTVAEPLK